MVVVLVEREVGREKKNWVFERKKEISSSEEQRNHISSSCVRVETVSGRAVCGHALIEDLHSV
jgi:hypothetical protein